MQQNKLELFHKQLCPYSKKVRDFIEANQLRDRVRYVDIEADEKHRLRLIDIAGREQVPCLVMDSRPLHDSDRIISWLDQYLVKTPLESERGEFLDTPPTEGSEYLDPAGNTSREDSSRL